MPRQASLPAALLPECRPAAPASSAECSPVLDAPLRSGRWELQRGGKCYQASSHLTKPRRIPRQNRRETRSQRQKQLTAASPSPRLQLSAGVPRKDGLSHTEELGRDSRRGREGRAEGGIRLAAWPPLPAGGCRPPPGLSPLCPGLALHHRVEIAVAERWRGPWRGAEAT